MTGAPTRARIEAWRHTADGLSTAAGHWRTGADELERSVERSADQIAAPGGTEWSGSGAEWAAAAADADRSNAFRDADFVRTLADLADRGADGLRWGRQLALAAIAEAERDGFAVGDDLSVADRRVRAGLGGTVARSRRARAHRAQIVHRATRLQTEDDRIADQLETGAVDLAGSARRAWRAGPAPSPPTPTAPLPPPPTTGAGDVAAWWAALTPPQRARLLGEQPRMLGNLAGVPATVRGDANASVLRGDIDRVDAVLRSLGVAPEAADGAGARVLDEPARYGLSAVDVTRYRNAKKTAAGLNHARRADHAARPALLWAYDPEAFDGKGSAAIAIGDPDTAHNTTVIVPGTGSSVARGWLAGRDDAINVFDRSVHAEPPRTTAVIAWMGYDAPDSLADRRVTEPGLARRGGELLARDVNGLWATHRGVEPQHVTVIGHSYGATTVADGFARGRLHANDAVLLGCPGTDLARSAADFHVDGGRVYVGSASTDPVSWIGQTDGLAGEMVKHHLRRIGMPLALDSGLGRDPAGQGFGAVRFYAEVAGSEQLSRADHARYYQHGSDALRAMTHIATGDPDRLAADGLLARGRHQPHLGAPSQVHLPGLPPVSIPHRDIRIPGIPAYLDPERGRGAS